MSEWDDPRCGNGSLAYGLVCAALVGAAALVVWLSRR